MWGPCRKNMISHFFGKIELFVGFCRREEGASTVKMSEVKTQF